tara:strand:- start:94363 stop:94572 length:210 start_codon:yes stop_codon:yes gene_type:complete
LPIASLLEAQALSPWERVKSVGLIESEDVQIKDGKISDLHSMDSVFTESNQLSLRDHRGRQINLISFCI